MPNKINLKKIIREEIKNILNERDDDRNPYRGLAQLTDILMEAQGLGRDARQIVKTYFPEELVAAEAYDVFNFGASKNRYDKTLEKMIGDIERRLNDEY